MATNGQWIFTIIDDDGVTVTETIVDEPKNWPDTRIKFKRDPRTHGIMVDYSFDSLKFIGDGMDILKDAYQARGIEAKTTIAISWDCSEQTISYQGKVNYEMYQENCSDDEGCWVECTIEQEGPVMTLKMREDQKVNLDSLESFDGVTLSAYDALGFLLTLEPKGILKRDRAERSSLGVFNSIVYNWVGWLNVFFETNPLEETPELSPDYSASFVALANFGSGGPQSRQIFENTNPLIGTYELEGRFKGRLHYVSGPTVRINRDIYLKVMTIAGGDDPNAVSGTLLAQYLIKAGPLTTNTPFNDSFDFNYSQSFSMNQHQKIYVFVDLDIDIDVGMDIRLEFDAETFFEVRGVEYHSSSTTKAYLLNEVFSRIVEAITNDELRVYSEYYGRTDAQPVPSAADGCGALRCIMSGLQVRNALIASTNEPVMAVSLKDAFDACKAIDCIGMGIEDDPDRPGYKRLRVEPFSFFYQNSVIMTCLNVNKKNKSVLPGAYIGQFKFGYSKYEAEEFNGIDEFLSQREYRSSLSQVKTVLDATCKWVASGYALEVTRQRIGNTKDWRYDNDTFIVCVKRDGSNIIVEQGNIDSSVNIIDPDSIYNFRIRPMENALRWFRILFSNYITGSSSAYFVFTSGTGNYFARGILTGGCVLERIDVETGENDTINYPVLDDQDAGLPLFTPERVKFNYPLRVSEFNTILSNPYGKIGYNFANQEVEYGWIDEIETRPYHSDANWTIIPQRTQ